MAENVILKSCSLRLIKNSDFVFRVRHGCVMSKANICMQLKEGAESDDYSHSSGKLSLLCSSSLFD